MTIWKLKRIFFFRILNFFAFVPTTYYEAHFHCMTKFEFCQHYFSVNSIRHFAIAASGRGMSAWTPSGDNKKRFLPRRRKRFLLFMCILHVFVLSPYYGAHLHYTTKSMRCQQYLLVNSIGGKK